MVDGRFSRRQVVKTVGVGGIVGLAGCAGSGGSGGGSGDGPIPVGTLAPFSQGLGWVGPNAARGRDVALQSINEETIMGREVEINEQDTETNPQAAVSGFTTLNEAEVVAMLGPSSSVIPNLFQPIRDAQLPTLSVSAGTIQMDDVGGPEEYLWRTVPSDAIAGRAQGQYALSQDFTSMAVTYKNDKGSQSFSASVADYFTGQGGDQAADVPLENNADSYRSEVQEIIDSGADVISMTAGTEVSALFMQNYIQAGTDIPLFLGNDVLTPDFIERVGADVLAESPVFGQAPAPGPAFDQFEQRHRDLHDEAPGTFGAAGYDAMNLIALAAVRGGAADRQTITQNINPVARPDGTEVSTFAEGKSELEAGNEINYQGASNPQNFDQNGDPVGPFSVLEVEDGSWVKLTTFSADELTT
jgi:ABC-type branched-subunit amino acid transport system substrate-binding protein